MTDRLAAAIASGDDATIRDAIRAAADEIREGRPGDVLEVAETVTGLASHVSARVRLAVAEASEVLVEAFAEPALTSLIDDADAYVKTAARRSLDRRASRKKVRAKDDDTRKLVDATLAEIEEAHGKGARRLAARVARRETDYFVRLLRHELMKIVTPLEYSLAAIGSALDEREVDRAAAKRGADVVRERLAFLRAVVDTAKGYTSEVAPDFREERLAPLVDEAAGHLADRMGDHRARLQVDNRVGRDVVAAVHGPSMLQAIQNVFQNAVEAFPPNAPRISITVTARAAKSGSQVVLEIRDDGDGMSDGVKARLFVPFGSVKPGGTGLGLLVVRKMIEEVHGGVLAIDSRVGAGTTVSMTIPAKQSGRRR